MVHIKRVELSNFKSFGGTTQIPLLPGFTVVSGPNGSGKSNILDALLFCLGLSSSKGMRAERLPDLVNHDKERRGTVEAKVTVTLDLSDLDQPLFLVGSDEELTNNGEPNEHQQDPEGMHLPGESTNNDAQASVNNHQPRVAQEWKVTRRLRVTRQGSYTSNYYINGEACTQTELHEQLNGLRIYPEGYNVVLQGDVTSIISMKSRERREIIDELAGVAAFDRKITQTKATLEDVKEREDRCRIIEKELIVQRDRLAADRIKAQKYQKLRGELQQKQQWEVVLKWRVLQQQEFQLQQQLEAGATQAQQLHSRINTIEQKISQATTELAQLNTLVKSLGEEEQLAVASSLAHQEAEQRQLQNRQQELAEQLQQILANRKKTQEEINHTEQIQQTLTTEKQEVETLQLTSLQTAREQAQAVLNHSREQANAIASASEAWVQQQTALTKQIEALLQTINPQLTQQAQLQERQSQLTRLTQEQTELLQTLEPEIATQQSQAAQLAEQLQANKQQLLFLTQSLATVEQELHLQQQTQTRLLAEQREKQRRLDKLEAQAQAQQEAQGTYATKIILETGIPGVCGLVAQLGRVEPRYQLALETAAGGRLGNLVVEDDGVAAAGIALLKQKKAGRATFLPLNKIQGRSLGETRAMRYARGFIDYALNLIDCEPRYRKIFAYVFGSTVVFATLDDARPYLGKQRLVTLEGEILESSGAITGGSHNQRSGLHFGTSEAGESTEVTALRNRLQEIEQILQRCGDLIERDSASVKQLTQQVTEAKTKRSETQLRLEQSRKESKNLGTQQEQVRSLLTKNTQELTAAQERLQILAGELPAQEAQLQDLRQQLHQLEESQTPKEWQQIQITIKAQEQDCAKCEQALRAAEKRLQDVENQLSRAQEKIAEGHQRLVEYQHQQQANQGHSTTISSELVLVKEKINHTQVALKELELRLGETKQKRDRAEEHLRQQQKQQQQLSWQLEKLQETQARRQEELTTLQAQLQIQQAELPDPLPEVPVLINSPVTESEESNSELVAFESFAAQLQQLQKEIRNGQKRLQGMEPVNMLALEEYDRTQTRLSELSEKLATLEAERTELLLRIENFTTLRFRAFKEAFDAINQNFQQIFAELSDGDGYLQLEDSKDPFNGGLNLVAHPKGKPVQRLASMSGGEKSLTALSFIFALQRYRPSPFYAFDEVDMFLDGANVERLARMIKQQAKLAQFIVVSLRRPMIASSERTIGVTQARGAYTQVLGLTLPSTKR
ncbi:MAG: chromosome segregation protein SMC [Symploca sp. SIO2E6]|nr:chromosome segregation protein SMC [Symploca sp. SIO2E6]